MHKKNARYRTKEALAADIVTVLALPLSYGTKYAVLDDALWKWSEFHGKYKGCPYWSVEALKIAGQTKKLRHEHLIPRRMLISMLMEEPPKLADSLITWLDRRCIGVVVTKSEDERLSKAGYQFQMPADWDGKDVWARYRAARIELAGAARDACGQALATPGNSP